MNRLIKKLFISFLVFVLSIGSVLGSTVIPTQAASNSKKTTIVFWHGLNGPYRKSLNTVVADFNKSQSKYKIVAKPQGNYAALQQKIMAAAKSKTLPVMSQATYTAVPDYAKDKLIVPLDSYLGKDKLSGVYPAFAQSSKYKGKYYSIPFSKSTRIMYYNQDLLDKYGLKKPTSWEEIQKDGQKLKSKNIAILTFDKSFDQEWEGLAKAAGSTFVDPNLKPKLTSKPVKTSANFIMNMVNKKEALTAGEDLYGDKNFTGGKSVLYVGSSAGISMMKQHAPKSLKWGTIPLPSYKGKKATQFAGNDLVMYKTASQKQKQGAVAFMKYLISKKTTIKWAKMTGYVPVRKAAVESKEYQDFLKKDPTAKAAVDSLPFGFQSTAFEGFSEFRNNLVSSVDNMLTQHTPVNQALKSLQAKTKTILDQNK